MARFLQVEFKTQNADFDAEAAKQQAFNLGQDLAKRMTESYVNFQKIALLRASKFATRKTYNSIKDEFALSSPSRYLIVRNVYASRSIVNIVTGRKAGLKPPPVSALEEWATALGIPHKWLFAIAKKIGRDGIKPVDVQASAVKLTKPAWQSAVATYTINLAKAIFKPIPRS